MTHYLIKHSDDEYRLYAEDGTEAVATTWSDRPDTNDLASAIVADVPDGSLFGKPELRAAFVDVVSGGVTYRDFTIEGETAPWKL